MIQRLSWDTKFFGHQVYKIDDPNKDELTDFISSIEHKKTLIYLCCDPSNKKIVEFCDNQNYFLADYKLRFQKEPIEFRKNENPKITIFDQSNHSMLLDSIYKLGYLSGRLSRFNVDPNIPRAKFEELYKLWIDNTINKSFGLQLLLSIENNQLSGMVTINAKQNKAFIGLIAVDEQFQGMSIGSRLLEEAEQIAYLHGCNSMEIVTQKDNIQACTFYSKHGYNIINEELVYHIWNKVDILI